MILDEVMAAAGIEHYGVAAYEDTLPGTGFKKRELFDGMDSVIVCLIPWDTGMNEGRNVARFAVGRNYHDVAAEHLSVAAEILRRAFPENTFKFFVDSSPIAEVRAANLAGLGIRGRNNLLISKAYGTRCAIGEIVTDRRFARSKKMPGGCFECGLCTEHCPNGALTEKGFVREKCVSYINQMKKELCSFGKHAVFLQHCRSEHCVAGNVGSGIAFVLNPSCGVHPCANHLGRLRLSAA